MRLFTEKYISHAQKLSVKKLWLQIFISFYRHWISTTSDRTSHQRVYDERCRLWSQSQQSTSCSIITFSRGTNPECRCSPNKSKQLKRDKTALDWKGQWLRSNRSPMQYELDFDTFDTRVKHLTDRSNNPHRTPSRIQPLKPISNASTNKSRRMHSCSWTLCWNHWRVCRTVCGSFANNFEQPC